VPDAKYRIQAVVGMTGVPAATLRAWERRYGIPQPQRTGSAYRLYTEVDVEAVKRLVDGKQQGLSAAQAAAAVRGWLVDQDASDTRHAVEGSTAYDHVRDELLRAIKEFDYVGLERAISRLLFVGNATTIFEQVLAPVQVAVGEMWHAGKLSVGQEHMASQLLEGAARDLLRLLEVPTDARNLVLACYPKEGHSLPLYGVAYRAVRAGLRPIVLGPRTPASAIATAVAGLDPVAVGLSITVARAAHEVREDTENFVRAADGVPVVVGGAGALVVQPIIETAGALVVAATSEGLGGLFERLRGAARHT